MGTFYPNLGSTRWIVSSESDGLTLTLDDGSLWAVEDTEVDSRTYERDLQGATGAEDGERTADQ